MSFIVRAPVGRIASVCAGATLVLLMTACSGSSRAVGTTPVGTTTGIVLTSSTNSTQLQPGGSLVLTATVASDPNKQGVSWTLTGVGALSNATTTAVTYTAPASGVVGVSTPVITATSVHDTTQVSTATMVVLGTPVITPPVLFPANVGVAYGAGVTVAGGLGPFTWALANSAQPPPGITFSTTSTTSITSFSGTPTTAGTYTFQVKVTDSNTPANVATASITIVVNPAEACLLNGQYAFMTTGFLNNEMTVSAGSYNVTSSGTVTGYHDYSASTPPVTESMTGTCTNRIANNGTLKFTGTGNSPEYDFALTTALSGGRIQLQNAGDAQSGSGFFLRQTSADFNQAALAGSFAFGTLGVQADGVRMALAGTVTFDVGGLVVDGHADSNGSNPLSDAALAGNLGAPDLNTGRGTLTLTATAAGGNQTFHFAYYVVSKDKLLLVTTDQAPRLAGYLTRQASGGFSNASLANPGILSLWGAQAVAAPKTVIELGRLSNANATNGTVDLQLDSANLANVSLNTAITGATYAVRAADGRTTLGFVNGNVTRQFTIYLDGPANGYVIEHSGTAGGSGLLEAQVSGPFTSTLPNFYI
ncbi:MAG: hypothetical protein KGJ52_07365, partial [Gammaproteobacteria bacterium]|nr:hypothetical protein [Gammaproteobacteria bacterium]